jgi:hypothetical protein
MNSQEAVPNVRSIKKKGRRDRSIACNSLRRMRATSEILCCRQLVGNNAKLILLFVDHCSCLLLAITIMTKLLLLCFE